MTELSCMHRRWLVTGGDEVVYEYDEKIALSKEYVADHKCDDVSVYRKLKGLKRIYYQKFKTPIYEETINESIPDDIADEENDIIGDINPFDKKRQKK